MQTVIDDVIAKQAAKYLAANDPLLAPVIQQVGSCTIRPHTNYYWELVDSIISQQLSVKAAASIERRFQELFGTEFPEPERIMEKSIDELRSVGLSGSKANYVRDLAQHIINGTVKLDRLDTLSNDEIMRELIAVKGIGEWTVHMFLMFAMARTDILPVGDLGIRNSMKRLYKLKSLPTPSEIKAISERYAWHPYESIASWYIWRSLNNLPD